MAATAIDRTPINVTDDSGSGTDGTILDAAWVTAFLDEIDDLFDGTTAAPFRFGGGLAVEVTSGAEVINVDSHGLKFFGATAQADALSDFEVGSWTPNDQSGASPPLTFAAATGRYLKIGYGVWVTFRVHWPTTSDTNQIKIGGLPFTVINAAAVEGGGYLRFTNSNMNGYTFVPYPNATYVVLHDFSGGGITNANQSGDYLAATVYYRVSGSPF